MSNVCEFQEIRMNDEWFLQQVGTARIKITIEQICFEIEFLYFLFENKNQSNNNPW
jgi:hypothetical protein